MRDLLRLTAFMFRGHKLISVLWIGLIFATVGLLLGLQSFYADVHFIVDRNETALEVGMAILNVILILGSIATAVGLTFYLGCFFNEASQKGASQKLPFSNISLQIFPLIVLSLQFFVNWFVAYRVFGAPTFSIWHLVLPLLLFFFLQRGRSKVGAMLRVFLVFVALLLPLFAGILEWTNYRTLLESESFLILMLFPLIVVIKRKYWYVPAASALLLLLPIFLVAARWTLLPVKSYGEAIEALWFVENRQTIKQFKKMSLDTNYWKANSRHRNHGTGEIGVTSFVTQRVINENFSSVEKKKLIDNLVVFEQVQDKWIRNGKISFSFSPFASGHRQTVIGQRNIDEETAELLKQDFKQLSIYTKLLPFEYSEEFVARGFDADYGYELLFESKLFETYHPNISNPVNKLIEKRLLALYNSNNAILRSVAWEKLKSAWNLNEGKFESHYFSQRPFELEDLQVVKEQLFSAERSLIEDWLYMGREEFLKRIKSIDHSNSKERSAFTYLNRLIDPYVFIKLGDVEIQRISLSQIIADNIRGFFGKGFRTLYLIETLEKEENWPKIQALKPAFNVPEES